MTDTERLSKLKDLLLTEDRDFANKILQKLDHLEETIYVSENLSEKINPIIDKKIDSFIETMPAKLGPTISETLKYEVKNSQDTIVDILFPIIGKLIKKYIQQEMKILSDNINLQVQQTLSIKRYQRKIKSMFFGVSENDIAMSEFGQPQIQQIFIIEKGSGLIIASFSKSDTIDEDMIAGMLTAIKSFVEDAFQGGNQSLENIEYELNTIQIQNFQSYYMAAVISGAVDTGFKSDLQDRLLDFANDKTNINFENKYLIEEKLETFFKNE